MYWKKYIQPYKWQALTGFFFKMSEAFFELMVPLVVSRIIDLGIGKRDVDMITKLGFVLFALALIGYCCALVCQYFASLTSQGFGTGMRRDMFKAINRYDFENLDTIGTASLITRMSNDVNQMQVAVAMAIRLVSRSPFLIFGSLIMAFTINVQMACIFLISAPLIGLSIYSVMSRSLPMYKKIQKQLDKVSRVCRENLTGVRVIRAFNKQEDEKKRFDEMTSIQRDMQINVGKLSALLNPATTIIVNSAIILILYVGGLKINVGTLTQGEVIALINYMNQILLSMYVFANVIVIFNKANASYSRVAEVLDTLPSIEEGKQQVKVNKDEPIIAFDHVSFSYRDTNALTDVTFSLKSGQTIGIIGGTGSGKSTLVHLIPRFYEATSGHIFIKGQPITSYPFEQLRKMIAIVPQKAVLFRGTIKDNLLWGNKEATAEDIQKSLELSQSLEFVQHLDKGIDTYIEQDGKNVSGGQKQRLTIARALIKKSDIIILDDSASALDFATDAKLRKALKTLPQTTIIVSQRVSSIMHCDHILVLAHGQIVGQGTHQSLLNDCSIYQEITSSQLGGTK